MRSSLFVALSALAAASAEYVCPTSVGQADMEAVSYALTVQTLLYNYYASIPVNASFFNDLPGATSSQSNSMTFAENTVTNVQGLQKQAQLGVEAIKQLGMTTQNATCNYTYPNATTGMEHLMNAYSIEATLCGTFIGLADYVQSPTAAFLMARMSAEHGIHASGIRAKLSPVNFMANSTALTPAFTPEMVMMSGMEVGYLGQYLNNCTMAPSAPCGGNVTIGMLNANLTMQSSSNASGASSAAMTSATSS